MEINKQLFEDVLLGKLKGIFVLRNGDKVKSYKLSIDTNTDTYYPIYLNENWYTYQGEFNLIRNHHLDIIDFLPETNMETKELEIQIPEGYEIDKEKSTFEKIVFKKKDTKPRSWEEYCDNFYPYEKHMHYIPKFTHGFYEDDADAFIAFGRLIRLHRAWIGDWKPDWNDDETIKWCIEYLKNEVGIFDYCTTHHSLTFPTKEMAEDFMNTFKDLLEIAKPLI